MWSLAKIYSVFAKSDEAYRIVQQLLAENPELYGQSEPDEMLALYAGSGRPYNAGLWMLGMQSVQLY